MMKTTENTLPTSTIPDREQLLRLISDAIVRKTEITTHYNSEEKNDSIAAHDPFVEVCDQLQNLYGNYEEQLPRAIISRCPFSGNAVRIAIDTIGLDGPWWNYDIPARPVEALPRTYFAHTGAINILGKIPNTPFICKPGPGTPFVVPRLLVRDEIRAVISCIRIGEHNAYPVFYFAEEPPLDIARTNNWGMDYYVAENIHGEGFSAHIIENDLDYDFDLEHYVRQGKLLWIGPGDEHMLLHSTVSDCPYFNLKGTQQPVAILDGKIWDCFPERRDK